ncbi:MAG: hypothetical protein IPG68_05495 [Micrococcales bacterium]|nr:hypothetical protein [Micrococcales bacterium]
MPFLITKSGTPELTYAQSRRAGLRKPTRGVRTDAAARSWLDDVAAVALTLPTDAAFSHTTAAQLLGLPTPHPDGRPFHVTVPTRRGTRKAVAWHQRGLSEVLTIGAVPVTGYRRTWMDLAGAPWTARRPRRATGHQRCARSAGRGRAGRPSEPVGARVPAAG